MENKGKGKRGGARVIYVDIELKETIYFINVYTKDEIKYICLPDSIETQYIRLLLKRNVSGNRYEFNIDFLYDKSIVTTYSLDYVNKDWIRKVSYADFIALKTTLEEEIRKLHDARLKYNEMTYEGLEDEQ